MLAFHRRLITLLVVLFAFVPAHGAEPLHRIAFGSCASQEKPQPIWDSVVVTRPDLFLFLGDNIYADTDSTDILKKKYAQFGAVPGYQRLLRTCPILATWDDHDYGTSNSGAEFPNKAGAQKAFLDFFGEPAESPRRRREGVYVAMVFGPVGQRIQVILLDTRYFRSPIRKSGGRYVLNTDPNATFLGQEQWQWLEKQLRNPAEIRLIGSSIQVVAEDHAYDKWQLIPAERERFFKLLRETKASGVVLLSGDRHLAELSQMDAGLGYPLFDVTSSGLNMASPRWRAPDKNGHRVATLTAGDNFGLITIEWDRSPPQIGLQIRDVAGDVAIQQKLDLNMLQPGFLPALPATTVQAPSSPDAISPAEAATKVGQKLILEMKVQATGQARDRSRVFLNSIDVRDPANFTVVLDMRVLGEKLKAAGVADPLTYYKSKTIRVTGTVSLFNDRPQIVVEDVAQLSVVDRP